MKRNKKDPGEPLLVELDVNDIEVPVGMIRKHDSEESLSELRNSIAALGLINPISVKKVGERYILIAGLRRYKAIVGLRREKIKAFVYAGREVKERAVMLHENIMREDINAVDEAEWVADLVKERGMKNVEAGRMMKRSEAWVRDRLGIAEYSKPLRDALRDGVLPLSVIREFAKVDDENQHVFWIEYGASSGVSVRTAKTWVEDYRLEQTRPVGGEQEVPLSDYIPDFAQQKYTCQICEREGEPGVFRFIRVCRDCMKIARAAMAEIVETDGDH